MSKYICFTDVVFKDRRLLLAALGDVGYAEIEQGEGLYLCGYQGDRRPEKADVVIRRRHLGSASNDIGFRSTPQGYVVVISEYDQRRLHGGQFLVQLRTAYGERVVEEVKRRLRGTAQRTVEGSVVKIRIRY